MNILRKCVARMRFELSRVGSALRTLCARAGSDVTFGNNVFVDSGVRFRTFDGGRIEIGADTHILRGTILHAAGGIIRIGPGSLVNCGGYITASREVTIGRDALIAEYVSIRDTEHRHSDASVAFSKQGNTAAAIRIGDNVWIGAKATVTKNVTIGSNTIVGANSVVTRSLDSGGKFAGAPARPITARPIKADPQTIPR